MEEPDGSSTHTHTEVGMTLRNEAVAFGKVGFDTHTHTRKWTLSADCHKLVEDHGGQDEALEEGLEAFGACPSDSDTDETDDEAGNPWARTQGT